ncbi:MAG: RecX family transcriptional regulator [Candidatus Promineifilaceae bacterium]|nr:RecX family transcriptional regulator [Candidatus Promineifilaceae bacterium]
MAIITAIKQQKRNSERFNVFLDGQFAFGLSADIAAGLRLGQELSAAQIFNLQQDDETEKARIKALQLIGRRPRSVAEIERNLRKNRYDDQVIERVITRLNDTELLDDFAFASYWVEQRETFRPRSKLALRQELQLKGVSRTVIDTVLIEVDEESAAHHVGQKRAVRWIGLPEKEFRMKLGRFLQQRGYPYDVVNMTIDKIWQKFSEEQDLDFNQSDH